MMPSAGVLRGAGGRLQLGGPGSHPNLRSLRGAFGSFDLPLVAEHRGHGVRSPDFDSKVFGGAWAGSCTDSPYMHPKSLEEGAFKLNYLFFLMK